MHWIVGRLRWKRRKQKADDDTILRILRKARDRTCGLLRRIGLPPGMHTRARGAAVRANACDAGLHPVTPLTAEDVRRIVREELAKLTPNG